MSGVKFVARPTQERGNADHDWLKTFHTFSFASYHGSGHDKFGSLRVINEDRVSPNNGFGTHSHREFEIFSYVVNGELNHRDSMGNTEVLKRGDLQLTSAGTGISHSEEAHGPQEVHFLQIWSIPSVSRLPPKYYTRHFTDAEKKDNFVHIVAPVDAEGVSLTREGAGPAPVQSPLNLFASLISPGVSLSHTFLSGPRKERKGYVHLVQTTKYNTGPGLASGAAIRISSEGAEPLVLKEGDGAYVFGEQGKVMTVENIGENGKVAEVLLFDIE